MDIHQNNSNNKKSEQNTNVERAELIELKRSNLEPHRIFDIRYGKSKHHFEFIISFTSLMNQNDKRNLIIDNLSILTDRYKNWLLSRFKKNLKDLAIIKKMKSWAQQRLQLLKEYCEYKKISFDALYLRSTLPPTQVFVNNAVKLKSPMSEKSSKTDELYNENEDNCIQNKPSCSSLKDRLPQEENKLKVSKKAKLKALFEELTKLQDKYKTLSSIDKNLFIKDLDHMSTFMCDV